MTDTQALKDAAKIKYDAQDRYVIIYTNYFVDMWDKYDALIAQGYTRAPHEYIIQANGNLNAAQIIYMAKPAAQQVAELQAIYDAIDAEAE
jgi:hypothetical protein